MILELLGVLAVGLLLAAALAPMNTLTWWARQDPGLMRAELATVQKSRRLPPAVTDPHPAWVIYMTGVGALTEIASPRGERPMLDGLVRALPGVGFVDDVYPYDMIGHGLLNGRWSAGFWRLVARLSRSRWTRLATILVYLRNILQFAVSADDRYGPLYSLALARTVWRRLLDDGYDPSSRRPVVLLGWSGGAQIATATATYLSTLGMPVYVLSVGGVLTSDPGLNRVRHVWQLTGRRDVVQRIGWIFPGRWPGRRRSEWARARATGRLTLHRIGEQKHVGRGSYLSSAPAGDGRTFRQVTIDAVADRVREVIAREP